MSSRGKPYCYNKKIGNCRGKSLDPPLLGVYVDDLIPVSNEIDMLNSEKEALYQRFQMDELKRTTY